MLARLVCGHLTVQEVNRRLLACVSAAERAQFDVVEHLGVLYGRVGDDTQHRVVPAAVLAELGGRVAAFVDEDERLVHLLRTAAPLGDLRCLAGIVVARTVGFDDVEAVRRVVRALAGPFLDAGAETGRFTTRLCGRTAVVYARLRSRDPLVDHLVAWVDGGCAGPAPTYPARAFALPEDAVGPELQDIDETADVELARRILPDLRFGPSDGRVARVRSPHLLPYYTRCLERGPLMLHELGAALDWPPELPMSLLLPFATRLFPDHLWGRRVFADRNGVQQCAVHLLRRAACVLHGALLAGTAADRIRASCV